MSKKLKKGDIVFFKPGKEFMKVVSTKVKKKDEIKAKEISKSSGKQKKGRYNLKKRWFKKL